MSKKSYDKDMESRIPEENIDPKSAIAREADAFLAAFANGADEDEADEAAFLAVNPDGIVVDDDDQVLNVGKKAAGFTIGQKAEIVDGDETVDNSQMDSSAAPQNDEQAEDIEEVSEDEISESEEEMGDAEGDEALVTFEDLDLAEPVLEAIKKMNYVTPSPIQVKAIPVLLQGNNLLGTAQTGTGKTAAFSLPLLSRLQFNGHETSMLVLTPTRELAIQVAEAIQQYAENMPKVHVVPVYGGQDIAVQIRALKRQANIIVATPGRLIDHIKRGTITLGGVKAIVLDEADEMLDMGFEEDVETILKEIPSDAQRALFSATMPKKVKAIIDKYLGEYDEACIESKTTTVENIRQRYLMVKNEHKIEALARVLEGEDFDGVLIFVRTKQNTTEVAEKLESRGFTVAPLNGDLAQSMRERTINRLKMGKLDIVVATDVAARGIDVDRISLVVNYDIPFDTESYVHRIGRTGRAGRSGDAILFITPREKRMLKIIERATRQPIDVMEMPTGEIISQKRVAAFKQKVKSVASYGQLDKFKDLVKALVEEGCNMTDGQVNEDGTVHPLTAEDIAAAVIKMYQKKQPLFPELAPLDAPREARRAKERDERSGKEKGGRDFIGAGTAGFDVEDRKRLNKERKEGNNGVEEGYLRYYLGVGRIDHVSPKDIVGAIAGEANISSSNIGRIKLFDKFSTVELPEAVPQDVLDILAGITIRGNDARFRLMTDEPPTGPAPGTRPRESRSFHRGEGRGNREERRGGFRKDRGFGDHDRGDRGGFGSKNREERRRDKFGDKPFRKDHDERDFGDNPFRKTRRFGRH
ncbi:DEAD/DEAH box helicase [Fibrobacter sp. UWR1]|uniref:DEAD/DEAH box helicase n=1 Tax=Fibrobacter sp. UWR1 TaxID=2135645 RepID=UPI000DB046CD|nr:DEAD/DEAH box helicase [Fibrobacter sp. UWR1]PZW66851.1 ATP-dependent RNA helicase CsdA [Fibrobacter sp. UWR1]